MRMSIITTLFNYSNFIGECIDSFLRENMKESEMIIVDDASTDDPYSVISQYESKKNVRYIRLDENMGYSYAKNIGIKASKAELLVMLDADDMLAEDSLRHRFRKIQEGFDFVHGPVFDLRRGRTALSKLWPKWVKEPTYKHVHAQGVMLRKQIHREIGLYDETLRCKSDREMWARVFNRGYRIGTVDYPVSIYRIHENQMSRSKEKIQQNTFLQGQVLRKIDKRKFDLSDLEMLV